MATTPEWEALQWIRASDNPAEECFEVAEGPDGLVHIRQTDDPEKVVTTTREKWRAFVLGVRNQEFDHLVRGNSSQASTGESSPDGRLNR